MLKKLCLTSLALAFGSMAFAQTAPVTTTTNYSSPVTIKSANGCSITGASSVSYDPSTNTITAVGGQDSCATGTPVQTASVSLSITPTSYTLGSGAAAPVVNVTNNTSAATVTCTLNPTNGFTVTSASTITNTGTFSLSAPTTAGTYTFAPVCTTSTPGYTVSVLPTAVSLAVAGGPPPPGSCDASQTATVGTKTLQRLCAGSMNVWPAGTAYNGALTDLGTVLGGKTFPTFSYAGYSPTFSIASGYYVALAFTPTVSGAIQFSANPSYGDGGVISLATQPGSLMQGSTGVICSLTRGGNNSLYVSTTAGSICQVQAGTTYFINFADVDTQGNNLCYGGKANTCASSLVSYTLYTSK